MSDRIRVRWQFHPYQHFRRGPGGWNSPPVFPYRYFWWCPEHETGESDLTWSDAILHVNWHLAVPHN